MSTAYHGTFWNPEEDIDPSEAIFFEPSTSMSDLDAVWFTNNEDVAKYFTSYHLNEEEKANGALRVILKGSLKPLKTISFQCDQSPWIEVTEDMDEIHVNDREELYSAMRNNGYNAFIIDDNYQEFGDPGSDIAVLEDDMFECESVALEKSDGSFTPFMSPEKARKVFIRHVISFKSEPEASPLEP